MVGFKRPFRGEKKPSKHFFKLSGRIRRTCTSETKRICKSLGVKRSKEQMRFRTCDDSALGQISPSHKNVPGQEHSCIDFYLVSCTWYYKLPPYIYSWGILAILFTLAFGAEI